MSLHRLLFFLLLGVIQVNGDNICPAQGGAYALCATKVVYIIDTSTDLNDNHIETEFSWIRNHILPGTAWGTDQQLALLSYGTGNLNSWQLTGSLQKACSQLNVLQNTYEALGNNAASLLATMKSVDLYYGQTVNNMVLFSASMDTNDIRQTGDYINRNMSSKHITVIAMGFANFADFPATVIYNVSDLANSPPNLPSCIIKNACNQGNTCGFFFKIKVPFQLLDYPFHYYLFPWGGHRESLLLMIREILLRSMRSLLLVVLILAIAIEAGKLRHKKRVAKRNGDSYSTSFYDYWDFSSVSLQSTTWSWPTPTTMGWGWLSTQAAQSTWNPPVSTPAPVWPIHANQGPSCSCNYGTVWLDIMFVMDDSAATTSQGLDEMWATAVTIMDFFNVQKVGYSATNSYTRVGVVTYGNNAKTVAALGSVNNDDLDSMNLAFNAGDSKTNLEAGIQNAVQQFEGPNHRSNVKKVMVIMASTYASAGVTAPQQAANSFKEGGGIIIVYNYVQGHGDPSPTLQEIASPGYFYSTLNGDQYTDIMKALCEANCFCAPNYASYTNSPRGSPNAGCYYTVEIQANYRLSSNKCVQFNNGTLAYSESAQKTAFLAQTFTHTSSQFYIAAVWDSSTYTWKWADGAPLGNYQPWGNGNAPSGANGLGCVFVDGNQRWQQTDCRNGYLYICEAPPCDSKNYCP